MISFVIFQVHQAFTYQCSGPYVECRNVYGRRIKGTSEDVAKACSNDHPKCKAYQYLPPMSYGGGYGYLCQSVLEDRTILNSEFCVKSQGYI